MDTVADILNVNHLKSKSYNSLVRKRRHTSTYFIINLSTHFQLSVPDLMDNGLLCSMLEGFDFRKSCLVFTVLKMQFEVYTYRPNPTVHQESKIRVLIAKILFSL